MAERRQINVTGSDTPSLKDLYEYVIMRVADKWKELGIELLSNEGGHSMLQIIAVDHPHDVVSCCKRLFEYWLQTTVDATWNQLIRTLRSPCVQLDYLADQLEQMMSTESMGSEVIAVEGAVIIHQIQDKNTVPTMGDISRYVTVTYAVAWKDIGIELGLELLILTGIERDHSLQNTVCFQVMIEKWIESNINATWRTLEVALTNVNRQKLDLDPVDEVYVNIMDTSDSNSMKVNDLPNDEYLNKYVREKVCAAGTNKWQELGVVLMGQDAVFVLDVIRTNHTNNIKECCSRMFTEWRQITPKASWKQLIEALKEVKLTQLASELEELLEPAEAYQIEKPSGSSMTSEQQQLAKQQKASSLDLKDDLICPVCYHLYKNPKYLPCHHSYCERCLEKMQVQSKIICPECRYEAIVPVGGVKDLLTDYYSNRKMVHKLNQGSNKDVTIQPKAINLMCKEHDLELLLYCETCEQLVCKYCVVKGHHGHTYANARIKVCRCQIELKEVTTPVEEVVKNLSETHDTIDEVKKKTKEDSPATKETHTKAILAHVIPVDGPYEINCDGRRGGYFVWDDCGLEISFPPECSHLHIQVTLSAFLPIRNDIYPGAHIVSAVYQFNCNIMRFNEAFTLCLQHCIELKSPEDCQKMCFIVQHDDSSIDVNYGHFEVGKSYGTVNLNRLCHVFIIWIHEPWKHIPVIVLPLSDVSSQQVFSNQLSSSGYSEELSTSQTDYKRNSLSASSQQHAFSESVPPSSNAVDFKVVNSPPYKYESMIGLPRNHCHLNDWNCVYSIYVQLGEWRKVSKVSMQMEEVINDFPVDFYAGEIDFDAGGVAMITCEKASDTMIDVNCWSYEIKKEDVNRKYEDYVDMCRKHPLSDRRTNVLRTIVRKSVIHVTKTNDTSSSNCQLIIKGIKPHQQVDLCTSCYTNLTLIDTINSRSTTNSNGPVPVASGELSFNDFHCLKKILAQIKTMDLKHEVEEFEKKIGATRRIPLYSTIKKKFDENILMKLSNQVGTNWKMIVRRLGVTDAEVDAIEHDYHKVKEQSYQGFRAWVDKNGGFEGANPAEIKRALLEFQLRRIAEEVLGDVI